MTGCTWFSEEKKDVVIEEASLDLPKIPYTTEIKGELPLEVEDHLKAVSLLLKLESRPPTSLNAFTTGSTMIRSVLNKLLRIRDTLTPGGFYT